MADTPKFFDASDLTDVFKELDAANEKGTYDLCMVDGSWMAGIPVNAC